MLDGKAPGLRVRRAIVAVNGVGVGDVLGSDGDESRGQCQHFRRAGIHAARKRKWRLPGQPQAEGNIGLAVVVDSITGADDGGPLDLRHFPRQSQARREVVVVGVDQAAGKFAGVRAGCARNHYRHCRITGRDIPVGHASVFFSQRRKILVADAEVESQAGPNLPVVLGVRAPNVVPEVGAGVSVADGAGLRQAEHEIRQIEARAGNGQASRIESAGSLAGKVEGAAAVLVGARIQVAAAELDAPGQSVGAARPYHALAPALALVARENRSGVAQGAEVGEVQIRGPVIQRIGRRARDAEFAGNVRAICKKRRRLAAVAVKSYLRVAHDARRDVARPSQVGAQAITGGGIQESECLDSVALAALPVDPEREAVLLGDIALNAQAGVVRVLWDRCKQLVVVHQPWLVRRRDVAHEFLGDGIEAAQRNDVAAERLVRQRIVELDRPAGLDALRKVTLPLEFGRDRRDLRGWIAGARAEVAHKKSGARVFHQLGNHQRPACHHTEARLRVRRLRGVLAGDRKRPGVQSRIVQSEKQHAVNAIWLPAVAELPAATWALAPAASKAAWAAPSAWSAAPTEASATTAASKTSGSAARAAASETGGVLLLRGKLVAAAEWKLLAEICSSVGGKALAKDYRDQKCLIAISRCRGGLLRLVGA